MSDRTGFSLFWRLNLVSAGILTVAGLAAVLLVNRSQRAAALEIAEVRARGILDRAVATHAFLNEELKPAVFTMPAARDAAFDPRWMSSSYAVRRIESRVKEGGQGGPEYKESAIDARHPGSEADPVERAFLQDARRDPSLVYRSSVREVDGSPYFEVLRRGEVSSAPCLRCHGVPADAPLGLVAAYGTERAFGWTSGQLVSAVSIRVPLANAYASANRLSLHLSAGIAAVLAAALLLQLWVQRRLVHRPLEVVRLEAARVAAGLPRQARPPRPGSLELRQLTEAFEAMEGAVASRQEELERAVEARTAELRRANEELARANAGLEKAAADRQVAEGLLRQASKMEAVGRLAGGVAHDFNNLLTAIGGATSELGDGVAPGDPRLEPLEEIRGATSRAAALVRQLMAVGRQEVVRPRAVEVNAALADTSRLLRRLLREDVNLVVVPAPGPVVVEVDPVHLEQVLLNLVVNASDAMPGGGQVTVAVRRVEGAAPAEGAARGNWVVLTVRDEGVGMDAATLAQAFEPFFTTKAAGGGTGLGLATVYAVASGFGGHVFATSEPGHGSEFSVWIPEGRGAAAPVGEVPLARGAGTAAIPPACGGTVLVVEDEAAVRRVVTRTLAQRGWQVLEASDGQVALDLLRLHADRIDVLVTDLVMPRMGGVELVARAREVGHRAGIVYMSGHADTAASRQEAATAGLFVQKPFSADQLAAAVSAAAASVGRGAGGQA